MLSYGRHKQARNKNEIYAALILYKIQRISNFGIEIFIFLILQNKYCTPYFDKRGMKTNHLTMNE